MHTQVYYTWCEIILFILWFLLASFISRTSLTSLFQCDNLKLMSCSSCVIIQLLILNIKRMATCKQMHVACGDMQISGNYNVTEHEVCHKSHSRNIWFSNRVHFTFTSDSSSLTEASTWPCPPVCAVYVTVARNKTKLRKFNFLSFSIRFFFPFSRWGMRMPVENWRTHSVRTNTQSIKPFIIVKRICMTVKP